MAEVLIEHPPHADGQTALLYERHGTRIYRFCLARLRSREEAEDAVQTTFLRVHGALRQGVVPHTEIAWLYKIAQNVCVTRAVASSRRARLEHAADLEQVNERVPATHRQHDELIGLGEALANMPPNLRRPFLLREWKGLSYAEIAEDLGVSQSAVETLIFRARRHLAGALDATGSRLRRAVKALNLGPVLDLMRSLVAGGAAKMAAVAAVAAVGVVGVTTAPGSHGRSPNPAPQVAPSGTKSGVVQRPIAGASGPTQPSAKAQPGAAGTQRNGAGGGLTGATSPASSAPAAGPAGTAPAAGPAPSGSSAPGAPSAGPRTAGPSGSSGQPNPPVVAVPKVPVTLPSGSSGLPEVPIPPLPSVPQVPAVPQVPPVPSPAVPPLPSLTPPPLPVTPPPLPVTPPSVPPVPPVPQPPPVPAVVPPIVPPIVPPVLPPPPPPPPLP